MVCATDLLILKEYGYDNVLLIYVQNIHPKNKQTAGTQGRLEGSGLQMIVLFVSTSRVSFRLYVGCGPLTGFQ